MRPIYLYVNIPKTGGHSVVSYLSEHIGMTRLCVLNMRNVDEKVPRLSRSEQIDVVIGHKVTKQLAHLFPNREVRFVTALRDPVDYMVSLYNHVTRPGRRGTRYADPKFSRWLEQHRNYQSRWLLREFAGRATGKEADSDCEIINAAKGLIDDFWLVGSLNSLNRSLTPFRKALGINQPLKEWKNIGGHDYEKAVSRTPEVEQKSVRRALSILRLWPC